MESLNDRVNKLIISLNKNINKELLGAIDANLNNNNIINEYALQYNQVANKRLHKVLVKLMSLNYKNAEYKK